jgi:hypothetical protein
LILQLITGKDRGGKTKEDLEVDEFENYTLEQISALPMEVIGIII